METTTNDNILSEYLTKAELAAQLNRSPKAPFDSLRAANFRKIYDTTAVF